MSSPDAFKGVLAWSHLALAAPGAQSPNQYHLALRANGVVADLPVPPSTAPFDPEVGPGPRGGTVVVYDRCGAGGCAMYIYSLHGATERRIATRTPRGCTDEAPSVWGKNLIFVRSAAKVTKTRETCRGGGRGLYVLTGNRIRLLRRGTTNGRCQGCGADLRGGVVASNTSPDGLDDQLRIDFLGRRRGFLLYRVGVML